MQQKLDQQKIFDINRPSPKLMTYYTLCCVLTGPLFPVLIVPNYFKYHTLRYRFDEEGVSMRWGILFRQEVILNYSRIQDIHLSSNIIERWLGLARVQIQTASGSASAEMTIEGIKEFEAVRDFLYSKMRGLKEKNPRQASELAVESSGREGLTLDGNTAKELIEALRSVSNELREFRASIASKTPTSKEASDAPET